MNQYFIICTQVATPRVWPQLQLQVQLELRDVSITQAPSARHSSDTSRLATIIFITHRDRLQ